MLKRYLQGLSDMEINKFLVAVSGSGNLSEAIVVVTDDDSDTIQFSTCSVEISIPGTWTNGDEEENFKLFKAAMESGISQCTPL